MGRDAPFPEDPDPDPITWEAFEVNFGLAASAVELLESALEIEIGLLLNERGMYSGDGDREGISASKASNCHSTSMAAIFATPDYLGD
jgi:hypothetical protein